MLEFKTFELFYHPYLTCELSTNTNYVIISKNMLRYKFVYRLQSLKR